MDTKMPKRTRCKDIARQLVEEEPGRNMNDKKNRKFVVSREELLAIDTNKTDYLLGLFSGDHMSYEDYRQDKQPSLLDMVVTAIEILQKRGNGFALMVEEQNEPTNTAGVGGFPALRALQDSHLPAK
ncbi:hypothetical protein HPB51_027827 [Rhipicephalus microplus]|uniref:alkaline phosphatase n=1 Tax=Rhipicephalus microplus TaxID=6941 RepID=A0A9J6CYV4_RHIMP|nr:hypothetical protein HPB51_027827 [Rhipicephalus microplus]